MAAARRRAAIEPGYMLVLGSASGDASLPATAEPGHDPPPSAIDFYQPQSEVRVSKGYDDWMQGQCRPVNRSNRNLTQTPKCGGPDGRADCYPNEP
jgi:hypothetical protein